VVTGSESSFSAWINTEKKDFVTSEILMINASYLMKAGLSITNIDVSHIGTSISLREAERMSPKPPGTAQTEGDDQEPFWGSIV
jgi:hypothetical protein